MSGFSADWLSLREPLDAASRSRDLSETLAQTLRRNNPHEEPIQVVDLGAGTGSNLRYLAPFIGGQQDWLLVDSDPLLLQTLNFKMAQGNGFTCHVSTLCCDLATGLDQVTFPRAGLISASALLDLVAGDWLASLARRCASAEAVVCFALTYDGRIECNPGDVEDAMVHDLVNLHQQSDKGFGPGLGPAAARNVASVFENCGYKTLCRPSDWRIRSNQQAIQRALVDGWFSAAREIAPQRELQLRLWHERRRMLIDKGQSELTVGHVDMIGSPLTFAKN